MYFRRPCTADSHCADDLGGRQAQGLVVGYPQGPGPLPCIGDDPRAPGAAILAVVAKADDVGVCAVAAGDGLILEDACNT